MQTGEFVVNGKLFTTNENGVVLSKTTMKNGWTNCQGSWYYYQNGIAPGIDKIFSIFSDVISFALPLHNTVANHLTINNIVGTNKGVVER